MAPRALGCFFVPLLAMACRSAELPPETPREGVWTNSPPVCPADHVREYHCEELLPREHALPAAAPFEACPASVESHQGLFTPVPPVALFDADYTAHTRRRMPPGHSCCFSWCAPAKVRDRALVPPNGRCDAVHTLREEYCLDVLEGGTSRGAARPFERCPEAIEPPAAAVYSVPPAASFDPGLTQQKRATGFAACCYAWCSKPPPASVKSKGR